MKISDCLLMLLYASEGIEQYNISMYLSKLIELGYVEIEGLKYKLTDKGTLKVRRLL